MIESTNKLPSPGPSKGLEVEVADIVQYVIVVPSNSTNDEQLVFVQDCGVSCSTLWYRATDARLRPMGGFEIEYDEVGEVGSVLIFSAEDQELVALV